MKFIFGTFSRDFAYFLVASDLKADETGFVTRLSTLSTNRRRENLMNWLLLLLILASLARLMLI